MDRINKTFVKEFILLGLSGYPKLEIIFFALLLALYLLILIGNHVLIIASIFDSRLHALIYFFLHNLSFLDVCYTSSSVPSTLVSLISKKRNISFSGCVVQMFLGFAMGSTECFFLGMMAFDRYVAICNPLRYPVIMSKVVYVLMASVSWLSGRINSIVQTSLAMRLPFCGNNIISHFLCEILAVLKLAYADISLNIVALAVSNIAFLVLLLLAIFFLLYVHPLHHLENEFSHRETQGLFHLFSAFDCGNYVLWYHLLYVCQTQVSRLSWTRQFAS